jgi:hypothetical protein
MGVEQICLKLKTLICDFVLMWNYAKFIYKTCTMMKIKKELHRLPQVSQLC